MSVLDPFYPGSEFLKTEVNFLVSPVDLFDIIDDAGPLGRQRCNKQCYTARISGDDMRIPRREY